MKRIIVRRVGVASVATLIGVINAIVAFVIAFFAMFGGLASVFQADLNIFGQVFGSIGVVLFSLVVVPVVAFLIGWLYGAVWAVVANFFLRSADGLELDVEETK